MNSRTAEPVPSSLRLIDEAHAKRILEALLLVYGQPVTVKRLTEVITELDSAHVKSLVEALNEEYAASGHAFHIQEVAGGYQLVTDQQLAPWIQRLLQGPKPDAVSKGALETLAIIAYRQPITKAEIEAIRGGDITASLDTLVERRFVRVAGRKDSPGRPFLYGTTPEFLRHFGLKSIEALPPMAQPTLTEPVDAPTTSVETTPPALAVIAADAHPSPQPQ